MYTDESIFQGWLQWHDEFGDGYRAESKGCGIYSVYKENGDAYVHLRAVRIDQRSKDKIAAIEDAMSEQFDDA